MLSYYAHLVVSQFFYFSSFHNSVLNVNDKEKLSCFIIFVHLNPQEVLLAQQKIDMLHIRLKFHTLGKILSVQLLNV